MREKLFEIDLPWPPTVNHYWRAVPYYNRKSKKHIARNILSSDGKVYKNKTRQLLFPLRLKLIEEKLFAEFRFYPPSNHVRDSDNYNKAVFDCMTGLVYKDDKQIKSYLVDFLPAEKNGRVAVSLYNYEN